MSKIKDPNLFHAVLAAAKKQLRNRAAPTIMLFPGQTEMVRAVDSFRLHNNFHAFDPSTVQANLVVRDAKTDRNRFTGAGPQGPLTDQGGLYTSFHTSAMTAEVWHYSSTTIVPRALVSKGIIRLRVCQPLTLLDLSSPHASAFLNGLHGVPSVQAALNAGPHRAQRLTDLLRHNDDFSVCRALGIAAALDLAIDGLHVGSARETDRAGETGANCVLFGPDEQPISHKVRAESVTLFTYSGKTKEVTPTVHQLDFDAAGKTYKSRP